MSYSKYYNPTNWENYPSEDTAINAMRLNHLEDGVDELDDRIVELSTDKSEVQWNQVLFAGQKIAEIEINGITQDVYCSQNEGDAAAQEAALKSEGYAIGKQNGSDVSPSSPYYHNNSKYYSQQASGSATSSENDALVSEGYATGKQNGQDVPSTSPYYHNNAKYYSDLTDPTALRNMSDVDFNNLQNGQVPVYNSTTEKWENGNGGGGASTLAGLLDVDIALPIGGQALVYDDVNDEWINAIVSGASSLNDLSDVTISSATQGQVLMKGSSVWENASLSKSDVGLGNVDNTSDANKPVSTATQIAISNAHKVTNKAVDLTSWTTDTTSQSGTTLYKKQITLNHIYSAPSVDVGAASGSVLPTVAEQTAYSLLKYVTYDDTVPCLYLYASDIPSTAFYIDVEGVD